MKRGVILFFLSVLLISCAVDKEQEYTFVNNSSYDLQIHFVEPDEVVDFPKQSTVTRTGYTFPGYSIINNDNGFITYDEYENKVVYRDYIYYYVDFTVINKTSYDSAFIIRTWFYGNPVYDDTIRVEAGKTKTDSFIFGETTKWTFHAEAPARYRIKSQGVASYEIELY